MSSNIGLINIISIHKYPDESSEKSGAAIADPDG